MSSSTSPIVLLLLLFHFSLAALSSPRQTALPLIHTGAYNFEVTWDFDSSDTNPVTRYVYKGYGAGISQVDLIVCTSLLLLMQIHIPTTGLQQ